MLNNSKKTQGKKLASKVTVPKSPPREPTAEESAEMERISERIKEMESEIQTQKESNAKLFEEIEKAASYQDDHNRVLDSITDEKTEMLEEIEQIHQTIQGCRELEMQKSMGNQYEQLTKEKDSLANAPFPWQKCGACQNQYSQEEEDRTPRTLACGHTICLGCAKHLIHKNKIKCPFDEVVSIVGRGPLATQLARNYRIQDVCEQNM
uniref:RING-type domain-containing protein n=1 Tax=Caenorhabditis tropicalis TaxID=1561998 RepID=A0A1I7T9Y9_9PELO